MNEGEVLCALERGQLTDEARGVFADWLHEQGRLDEAELLGVEPRLRAGEGRAVVARCLELAAKVAPAWRRRLLGAPGLAMEVVNQLHPRWGSMRALALGGGQDRDVLISYGESPILRLELPAASEGPFSAQLVWAGLVVFGLMDEVYVVDPFTAEVTTLALAGYFGHAYPCATCLLLASSERLYRLEPDASLAWTSPAVGLDGVVVHELTDDGRILGEGEWDPPGGWRPFVLDLATGVAVSDLER